MSDEPTAVERFNVHDTEWEPFPEFDGSKATLYSSADGTKLAASYKLSGTHSWVLPYDDYFYVIAGHARVSVKGGETFEVSAGDFCHLRGGNRVTFEMSDDFHEVSTLVADKPFDITSH